MFVACKLNYRVLTSIMAAVLLLLCVACGSGHEKTAAADDVEAARVPGHVVLLPEDFSSVDDLRAVYSGGGGKVVYAWEVNGKVVEGETGDVLPKGSFFKGDTVRVRVEANGVETGAEAVVRNAPPSIRGVKIVPQPPVSGTDVNARAEAFDPDEDMMRFEYAWTVNGREMAASPGDGTLDVDLFDRGDELMLRVSAHDGTDWSEPVATGPFIVNNAPPRITTVPPGAFTSHTYVYNPEAVDPDGDAIEFSLEEGPEGMDVADDGKVVWDLSGVEGRSYPVEITVTDGHGGKDSQRFAITVERH